MIAAAREIALHHHRLRGICSSSVVHRFLNAHVSLRRCRCTGDQAGNRRAITGVLDTEMASRTAAVTSSILNASIKRKTWTNSRLPCLPIPPRAGDATWQTPRAAASSPVGRPGPEQDIRHAVDHEHVGHGRKRHRGYGVTEDVMRPRHRRGRDTKIHAVSTSDYQEAVHDAIEDAAKESKRRLRRPSSAS